MGSAVGLILTMWISVGSYLIPPVPPLYTSTAKCAWNGTNSSNCTVSTDIPQPVYVFSFAEI